MKEKKHLPFSVRENTSFKQITGSFPDTAVVGLQHILADCVDKNYIENWTSVARELRKIARDEVIDYLYNNSQDRYNAKIYCLEKLQTIPWQKQYDFCEAIYFKLVFDPDKFSNNYGDEMSFTLNDARTYIENEIQQLFMEESLPYDFIQGEVVRRGRAHTIQNMERARYVMNDTRLKDARKHFSKALSFFHNVKQPDYENTVKEAVCALESAGKELFPEFKAKTLGDLISNLKKHNEELAIPIALFKTIEGIYGLRNSGEGVAHGGASGGVITPEVTEYTLNLCASTIIYLVDISNSIELEVSF